MKKKIYLELGTTLIIGILIGFFANSVVTDRRIKDFSMHKGETLFWHKVLGEIDATDEQREKINPIIKKYSDKTHKTVQETWNKIPLIWDEMENEIMIVLTDDQQKKVLEIQKVRKLEIKKRIKQRNPDDRGSNGQKKKDRKNGTQHPKNEKR